MGVAFVQILGARIAAPFKILDQRKFGAQGAEGGFDGCHGFIVGSVVEFE
jgi:hypothetical protein